MEGTSLHTPPTPTSPPPNSEPVSSGDLIRDIDVETAILRAWVDDLRAIVGMLRQVRALQKSVRV